MQLPRGQLVRMLCILSQYRLQQTPGPPGWSVLEGSGDPSTPCPWMSIGLPPAERHCPSVQREKYLRGDLIKACVGLTELPWSLLCDTSLLSWPSY